VMCDSTPFEVVYLSKVQDWIQDGCQYMRYNAIEKFMGSAQIMVCLRTHTMFSTMSVAFGMLDGNTGMTKGKFTSITLKMSSFACPIHATSLFHQILLSLEYWRTHCYSNQWRTASSVRRWREHRRINDYRLQSMEIMSTLNVVECSWCAFCLTAVRQQHYRQPADYNGGQQMTSGKRRPMSRIPACNHRGLSK